MSLTTLNVSKFESWWFRVPGFGSQVSDFRMQISVSNNVTPSGLESPDTSADYAACYFQLDTLGARSHLTECINQMVLESQLPHNLVNLFFTITTENNISTVLGGGVTF